MVSECWRSAEVYITFLRSSSNMRTANRYMRATHIYQTIRCHYGTNGITKKKDSAMAIDFPAQSYSNSVAIYWEKTKLNPLSIQD